MYRYLMIPVSTVAMHLNVFIHNKKVSHLADLYSLQQHNSYIVTGVIDSKAATHLSLLKKEFSGVCLSIACICILDRGITLQNYIYPVPFHEGIN